jgi:hypothetical protein
LVKSYTSAYLSGNRFIQEWGRTGILRDAVRGALWVFLAAMRATPLAPGKKGGREALPAVIRINGPSHLLSHQGMHGGDR